MYIIFSLIFNFFGVLCFSIYFCLNLQSKEVSKKLLKQRSFQFRGQSVTESIKKRIKNVIRMLLKDIDSQADFMSVEKFSEAWIFKI